MLSLGRTTLYRLIGENKLRPKKVGNRTLFLITDLEKFIDACPEANDVP